MTKSINERLVNLILNNNKCNALEKRFISGIDKMQQFLFKDIKYKSFWRSLKRTFIHIHMQIIKKR